MTASKIQQKEVAKNDSTNEIKKIKVKLIRIQQEVLLKMLNRKQNMPGSCNNQRT